ncbi:hypothetical protein [Lactococcus lactis]|uniref:hypothetical protein n=1 Tax=Lactococcus lactis TaxID=1358 RepID=UPI0021A5C89E|nr:hypothetical protein [Lactococcus lactis]MCT0052054.1 hypothetical protein [Lactococcus lactis subsp. lactis]
MKEIKLGTNLELTVSELVEEYSQLLTNEIVTSFQKQGRFTGNTKKSVIKALENKFESVEYVAGAGKRKAKFILTNYNGNVEAYNPYKINGGSVAYDWTEVDNMIKNQIAKYSNDKGYHSISSIIHSSLKIEYISDAVNNLYDELTDFKTLENGDKKYNIEELNKIFEWFERYQLNNIKNRVRYILKNESIDFKEKYMALQTGGKFVNISSEKYKEIQKYKAEETELLQDLKGNAKMHVPRVVSENINHKFGYINVYTTFSFIDTEKLSNDDFDLQKIKLELLEKWEKQGLKKEKKELQKEALLFESFFIQESFYKELFKNKEYAKLMNTFVKLHLLA